MLRNTAAIPGASQFVRPANTAGDLPALEQAAIGQVSTTGSKLKSVPAETLQAIQKIANESIQNYERIDSLKQSIGLLTQLKKEALKEKALITQHEIAFKQRIKGEIDAITKKEKSVRNQISNVSEEIQSLEKKQDKQARLAAEREVEFNKHFSGYKTLLEGKNALAGRKSSLSENNLALRHGIAEKKVVVNSLESKMKSLDASIKKVLEGGVAEAYEETVHTSAALLKKHGKQVLSESTMEELTNYLCRMTDQPKTKAEKIKDVENKHRIIKYAVNMTVIAIAPAIIGGIYKTLQPYQLERDRIGNTIAYSRSERVRLNRQYEAAEAAYNKKHNEMLGIIGVAAVLVAIFAFAGKKLQSGLLKKATDNIRMNESEPTQRTLRSGAINGELGPSKSAEEALFKFAFGLAQHANMKLIKSPLEIMTKEVTRLVMEAKVNGRGSINIDAIDKEEIHDYVNRLKSTLGKENERLEKKVNAELLRLVNGVVRRGEREGEGRVSFTTVERRDYYLSFLTTSSIHQKSLPEKVEFLKTFLTDEKTKLLADHEAKAVCDMAAKAEFIYEFSKVFSGSNETMLADAIRNMIGSLAQEMFNKWQSADTVPVNAETSTLERRIKHVDQEKQSLDQILKQARADLADIVKENEKIEEEIKGVEKEIRGNDDAIGVHKSAMVSIPLTKDQLAIYQSELSSTGIHVQPQGEYSGLSAAKARHVKERQREEKERLPALLKTHDTLHDQYAELQVNKKHKEDQLERTEFLEKI